MLGPHAQLLTSYLPSYLAAKTYEPVTKQASKTQPISKFRNPQLVVNPCLALVPAACDLAHVLPPPEESISHTGTTA